MTWNKLWEWSQIFGLLPPLGVARDQAAEDLPRGQGKAVLPQAQRGLSLNRAEASPPSQGVSSQVLPRAGAKVSE